MTARRGTVVPLRPVPEQGPAEDRLQGPAPQPGKDLPPGASDQPPAEPLAEPVPSPPPRRTDPVLRHRRAKQRVASLRRKLPSGPAWPWPSPPPDDEPGPTDAQLGVPRPISGARWWRLAQLLLIGLGQAAAAIGFALLMERGFNTLVTPAATSTGADTPATTAPIPVGWLAGGLALAIVGSGWLMRMERVYAEKLGQHYVTEVRERLFAHLTEVPARAMGKKNRGSMLMKFVGDLSALRLWVARGLARLIVAGIAITISLAALAFMNRWLAVGVGSILLAGAALTIALAPWMMKTARESRRRRSRLTGEVTERLTQVAVVQATGQERRERRRVGRRSDKVAAAMVDQARASGAARAVAEGTGVAASAAALVIGGLEVRSGGASPGTVVAAVSIAGMLATYLRDLGRVAEYASRAAVARRAVRRFLRIPVLPQVPGAPDLLVLRGEVDIDDVHLADVLRGITVHAEPGQRVVVVGTNGAGKTTLASLVSRAIDPDRGSVCIDQQDLRSRSLASVRRAVGVASPALPLLTGSMRRNVTYRLPKVSARELARVSDLCRLSELAASLPKGWESEVGAGGSRLSAGQQARIAIARAALGRPPVLILDEAEAHLDRASAGVLDAVLDDHRGTSIVVTHRRERVEAADVVWCMDEGKVVEVGPPDVLLAGDGPTARLFAPEVQG